MSCRSALLAALLVLVACAGKTPVVPSASPKAVAEVLAGRDLPLTGSYIGRTTPLRSVAFQARVTASLLERPFAEGATVKAGDVLFRLDQAQFAVARDSATAKLAQAQARLAKAQLDHDRIVPLAKVGAATQSDADLAISNLLSCKADALVAKAALDDADLNLGYATISAPFAGRIGKANVDPGALVTPQLGTLAILDQIDPIAIDFTVAEADLLAIRRGIETGRLAPVDKDGWRLKARLSDGSEYPETGRIAFADIRISPETGTALLRAEFPNPRGLLRPGQFIRVGIHGLVMLQVVVVPQSAVMQDPSGAAVYVIGTDGKAEARRIVLGDWQGVGWVVREGLKPGECIAVDGISHIRAGAAVEAVTAPAAR